MCARSRGRGLFVAGMMCVYAVARGQSRWRSVVEGVTRVYVYIQRVAQTAGLVRESVGQGMRRRNPKAVVMIAG